METCEVLIIGGGPAGSTCARQLRQAGLDVLVLDSREFPRDKPCAGWITPAVLKTLEIDADEYRQGRVLQDITGFMTGIMHGTEVITRYNRTVSYGIRRLEFDQYLLQRSDVRLVLGEPVTMLDRNGSDWIVNGRIRAKLVVGAGGHFCPVARLMGARIGAEEIIVAQNAEFELAGYRERMCRIRHDRPELFFSRDLKGYGWAIRKGHFLNVGFGRMEKADFPRQMTEFRRLLEMRGVVAPGSGVRYQGHVYLAYQHQGGRKRVDNGVLVIGDAAGLAHPHSGEGILPAIESALMASRTIMAANGDYRRDNLEPYAAMIADRYGKGRLDLRLPSSLVSFIAPRLLSNRLFVRHVALDRWFLHRTQKSLSLDLKAA